MFLLQGAFIFWLHGPCLACPGVAVLLRGFVLQWRWHWSGCAVIVRIIARHAQALLHMGLHYAVQGLHYAAQELSCIVQWLHYGALLGTVIYRVCSLRRMGSISRVYLLRMRCDMLPRQVYGTQRLCYVAQRQHTLRTRAIAVKGPHDVAQ